MQIRLRQKFVYLLDIKMKINFYFKNKNEEVKFVLISLSFLISKR